MPGIIYRVIPRQVLTAAGAATSFDIAKGIDVSNYREATLILRVHVGTNLGGATPLTITVLQDAPTNEDSSEFVGATLATVSPVTGAVSTGTVTIAGLTGAVLPAFVRVRCTWTATGTGQAVISADIVAKS